jgi:hypothetical protein
MLLLPILLTALVAGDCGSTGVHTFPVGLADAKAGVAYVQSDAGYVDALELRSGKRIWESSEKAKPLGLYDDSLVAAAPGNVRNELVIIVLDKARGSAGRSPTVSFPYPVNTAASGFAYSVAQNKNSLELAWSYVYPNRGGAMRRLDSGVPLPPSLSGLKLIDLDKGLVKDAGPNAEATAPKIKDGNRPFSRRDDSTAFDPWHVGNSDVQLLIQDLSSQKQLVLKTFSAKGKPETHVLLSGHKPSPYKSGDGCFLFLIRSSPNEVQPWYVFSVLRGTLVGRVTFRPGSDQPDVVGSTAFWLLAKHSEPGKETHILEAADLATGKLLWRYVLGTVPYNPGSKRLE